MENSKTYGSAYKELRLSKKFTLKEAAGTSISIGQLSNFENGKSILRVDSFFSVLKNINVTNLEFEVSLDKHSEIKAFPYNVDLSDIYLTRNTTKLKRMIELCKQDIKLSPSSSILKVKELSLEGLYYTISKKKPSKSFNLEPVINYLLGIEEYGMFELSVLNNCLPFFDLISLSRIINCLINPIHFVTHIPFTQTLLVQIINDSITIFLTENQLEAAEKFIIYLEELELLESSIYEKLNIKLSRELLSIKQGKKNNLDKINYIKGVLEFCDNSHSIRVINEKIETVLKISYE